jgi:hypothetical protein
VAVEGTVGGAGEQQRACGDLGVVPVELEDVWRRLEVSCDGETPGHGGGRRHELESMVMEAVGRDREERCVGEGLVEATSDPFYGRRWPSSVRSLRRRGNRWRNISSMTARWSLGGGAEELALAQPDRWWSTQLRYSAEHRSGEQRH